eukprot:TRINITY_DN8113_c0_g5_i1.p1 TRINITY_DN8113_c0_g5~~TRINITY_DN8113_c0_g5_i1.p1  ORF type:complete len:211 (+),score=14.95 TRINITY_DN8113_c0_g5_i1:344-976(+)
MLRTSSCVTGASFLRQSFQHCFAWGSSRLVSTENVPAGHHNSDLSNSVCHIGLNRRRDITLRSDIKVFLNEAPSNLAGVFVGHNSVVVGLPDCGSVCKQKHVPSYVSSLQDFKAAGFQVILASVASPEALKNFAESAGAPGDVKLLADPHGSFTRMLGLEINEPTADPPYSQRYAAFLEDNILVKLCVDKDPSQVHASDAANALKVISQL